jgi:hypothetical protein
VTSSDSLKWAGMVTNYFGPQVKGTIGHGYSQELTSDIAQAFLGLSDADAQRIYTQLKLDLKSSFKVDVRAIYEAKNQLGIIGGEQYSGAPQFQTVKWNCQACAKTFNFNYLPNEGDEYREIFNFCPKCGFVQRVTLYLEGNRVTYIEDHKMIEKLSVKRDHQVAIGESVNYSWMDYYREKKGMFFDKVRERDSEIKLYTEKKLDDEYRRLVEHRRFA